MTPEERAEKLMGGKREYLRLRVGGVGYADEMRQHGATYDTAVALIAQAIRDAENAALERAAVAFEEMLKLETMELGEGLKHQFVGAYIAVNLGAIAPFSEPQDYIRSLKSKEN